MKNSLFIFLFTTYGTWFVLLNTKYFNNNYNILLILAFGFTIGTLFIKRRKNRY